MGRRKGGEKHAYSFHGGKSSRTEWKRGELYVTCSCSRFLLLPVCTFFLRRKLSFLKSSQLFPELTFRRHSLRTLGRRHQCSPPSYDGLSSSGSSRPPQVRHGTAQSKWRLDTPQCVTPRTRRNRKNGAPPSSGTGNSTKSNVPRTVPASGHRFYLLFCTGGQIF